MILHNITANPVNSSAFSQLTKRFAKGDTLLFSQDGVYVVLAPSILTDLANAEIHTFVLQEDIQARGLASSNSSFNVINYPKWVELTLICSNMISWKI